MQTKLQNIIPVCLLHCSTATAYRPRLVTQVVDGLQGVDTWYTPILETNNHVAKILILGHTEGVLTNQDKVGLEGPAEGWRQNKDEATSHTGSDGWLCLCCSPHNLGAVSESLHVNNAGSIGVSHHIDIIEFCLKRQELKRF